MRVLIVEDLDETSFWLSEVVTIAFPDAQIATANSLLMARVLLNHSFDLALIDLRLPDGSGLDLLYQIRKEGLSTIGVVITVLGDDASIVGALSAGAMGYLLKDNSSAVLVWQLQQVLMGVPALSPSIARRIMDHFSSTAPAHTLECTLTGRETDVLALISRGLRNSEVAEILGLSPTTVASYIKNIYQKLGISSRAEASWHALRMGLNRDQNSRSDK